MLPSTAVEDGLSDQEEEEKERSSHRLKCIALQRIHPHELQQSLRRAFRCVGLSIGRHPLPFFLLPLLLSLACSAGLPRLSFAQHLQEGFVSQNSRSKVEEAVKTLFDGRDYRSLSRFTALIRRRDRGNLLDKGYIKQVLEVLKYISNDMEVVVDGRRWTHSQLCETHCDSNALFLLFENCLSDRDERGDSSSCIIDHPQSFLHGQPFLIAHHLFGIHRPSSKVLNLSTGDIGYELLGQPTAPPASRLAAVEMIALYWLTPIPDDATTNIVARWENKVFEFSQNRLLFKNLTIDLMGDKLLGAEMVRGGLSLLPHLLAGFFLILLLSALCILIPALLQRRLHHALIIVIFGIIAPPLLASSAAFGVLGLLSLPIYPFLLVIPVLILAIGVDNAFLLEHTWRRKRAERVAIGEELDSAEILASVLEDFGPSILITSNTNALAFGIGSIPATPANRLFCGSTTLAVVIAFVLQIAVFGAVLVISARFEPLPVADLKKPKKRRRAGRFLRLYSRFITYRPIQLAVIAVTVLLFVLNVFAASSIETAIDSQRIIPHDSPLRHSDTLNVDYFWKEFEPVEVIVGRPPRLDDDAELAAFDAFVHELETLPRAIGHPSTVIFLESFRKMYSEFYLLFSFIAADTSLSYDDLPHFLNLTGAGRFWAPTVRWHFQQESKHVVLDSFKFFTGFHNSTSWMQRAENMINWRRVADKWSKFNVTIYSEMSPIFEGLFELKHTTILTASFTLLAMVVVCFFFIPSQAGVVIAGSAVCSISIGVMGALRFLGYALDPITQAAILMSIGMSVDYTAHVAFHFQRCHQELPSSSKPARFVEETISSVGLPLLQAAASSVLCFVPIFFHPDYTPQVFVCAIFSVVGLSLVHGLLVLPATLSLLGPSCFQGPDSKKSSSPHADHVRPLVLDTGVKSGCPPSAMLVTSPSSTEVGGASNAPPTSESDEGFSDGASSFNSTNDPLLPTAKEDGENQKLSTA